MRNELVCSGRESLPEAAPPVFNAGAEAGPVECSGKGEGQPTTAVAAIWDKSLFATTRSTAAVEAARC
jgi:hypothetical protein